MATTRATTTSAGALDHRVGFRSADREVARAQLEVDGALPPWLTGTLLRTGPARFEAGGRRVNHWFDGLAMLHSFSIADGGVSYAGRFLESSAYRAVRDDGRIAFSEFASDPCRSTFKRVFSIFSPKLTDNGNVNVVRLGEQFAAMTETPMPVVFDPETLDTLGVAEWGRRIPGQHATAHPHHDRRTRELIAYAIRMSAISQYRLYALSPDARERRPLRSIRVSRPAYMHSFAMTDRYLVLTEAPLVVNPLRLALSGRPFIENYRWEPQRGARFLIVDRGDGSVREVPTAPLFVFHHVNAFEDGSGLVLDVAAYDDPTVIDSLYLPAIDEGREIPTAELRRYRLPLDGGEASSERLAESSLELPRIDYERRNGRPYSFVYGIGVRSDAHGGEAGPRSTLANQLVKVDTRDGRALEWRVDGCFPGEPVFVREPDADREDAGVVLSVVLDGVAGRSFLLVLDARSFEEVARARVPQRIPLGLHGSFYEDLVGG